MIRKPQTGVPTSEPPGGSRTQNATAVAYVEKCRKCKQLPCTWPVATDEQKQFRQVTPLALFMLLLMVAGFGVILTEGIAKLPFQWIIGVLFAHGVELVHQCLHKTASGRATIDHALGMVLGWPALVSFWHYLYFHWWHHRHNGTELDQESFGYAYEMLKSSARLTRLLGFAWHLSQIKHYLTAVSRMYLAARGQLHSKLKASTPEMPDRIARLIQRDFRIMACILVVTIAVSVVFQSTLLIQLWLIPLLLAYGPAHALIELPEHFECDHPTEDVLSNTRSIKAGRFMRWLTNGNNFHVEHHLDPSIPIENLSAFSEQLCRTEQLKHVEESYLRFYTRVCRHLWYGDRETKT
jgi:fatty acid desaturase